MSAIELRNLVKSFGKTTIINGIDLTMKDGEFVVLVGPSGCGKSTVLRLIAGLEQASGGGIYMDDKEVTTMPPSKRNLAMVFQSYALYPHLTVFENIAFGMRISGEPKDSIKSRVEEVAATLQVTEQLQKLPKQLSGGQRQRIAIARALVRQPQLYLFDEPLSNLDASLRIHTRVELAKLHNKLQTTMIYVTHDQVEAMTLADTIVVLNKGKIEQCGTPMDLYFKPKNIFVANFIGSPEMNFIEASIENTGSSGSKMTLMNQKTSTKGPKCDLKPGAAITLGIRPEDIEACDKRGSLFSGTVELLESLGEYNLIHFRTANDMLYIIKTSIGDKYEAGETIHLRAENAKIHVFDQQEQIIYNGF